MRRLKKSTVVVVPLVLLVWSLWPLDRLVPMASVEAQFGGPAAGEGAAAGDTEADEVRRNAETLRKLAKRIEAEYPDTPLQDVLHHLAATVGVQFYVDRRALEESGVDTDTPVTLQLKDVPADMVLELVLEEQDLAFYLRQGIVMITSEDEASQHLLARVYDVSELADASVTHATSHERGGGGGGFFSVASEADSRRGRQHACQFGGGMGGGLGGGGGFGGEMGGPLAGGLGPIDEVSELANLIEVTVEPDSWNNVGGVGSIIPYRNTLVISQTPLVHAQIESLLRQLRATEGARQPRPHAEVEGHGHGHAEAVDEGAGANPHEETKAEEKAE